MPATSPQTASEPAMNRITYVKKILADGTLCRKCADVQTRLEKDGHIDRIDRIVVADERDPNSEGMVLAQQHGVNRAPFFIVEEPGAAPRVYTVYLQFVRDELKQRTEKSDEAVDILQSNPDLDYL